MKRWHGCCLQNAGRLALIHGEHRALRLYLDMGYQPNEVDLWVGGKRGLAVKGLLLEKGYEVLE
jgi:hypothetical protein